MGDGGNPGALICDHEAISCGQRGLRAINHDRP